MYEENKANIGEVPAASPLGRHRFPDDSTTSPDPEVGLCSASSNLDPARPPISELGAWRSARRV